VATDIAARGLDIDQLPHVVNFELPNVAEDYIHRIGRTGRAGNEGEAMSLVCVDELKLLKDIERLVKRDIPRVVIGDFKPDPSIKAQPINMGRGNQQKAPRNNSGKSTGNKQTRKESNGKSAAPWNKQRSPGKKGRPNNQSPPRNRTRRSSRNAA
jgi:ATP-dependent RNA helicase RhlE